MLVEFSVENFRSIRDRQTLSMVAGTSAAKRHQHSMDSGNSFAPQVLRSACVFGPNGAGKTSLVRAMSFFTSFVASSAAARTEGDPIRVTPFKADESRLLSPSEFEAHFIVGGTLYQYGFSATKDRIVGEWLFLRASAAGSRTRVVFQREYDEDVDEYAWEINDDLLRGEKDVWKKSTRVNALFLSTAVQLNAKNLTEPYRWITSYFRIIPSPERIQVGVTIEASKDAEKKSRILELLVSLDLPIVDFSYEERRIDFSELEKTFAAEFLETMKKVAVEEKEYSVTTVHKLPDKIVHYDLLDESDGTRVLFALAGPLIETYDEGYTIVVDELNNSLHPLVLRFIVGLFHNPDINTGSAQLLFTSHDTAVMAKGFMHRDQIWLTQRDEESGTELVPLSDFKVREVQSFQRAYLGGKFGALPSIKRWQVGPER